MFFLKHWITRSYISIIFDMMKINMCLKSSLHSKKRPLLNIDDHVEIEHKCRNVRVARRESVRIKDLINRLLLQLSHLSYRVGHYL